MATYDALKSEHQTLTSTTADTVKLTQYWDFIEVANRSLTTALYFSQTDSTPTSAEENTEYVAPGSSVVVRAIKQGAGVPGSTTYPCHTVHVVGDANAYSVTGLSAN